jgi:hypothetical protein
MDDQSNMRRNSGKAIRSLWLLIGIMTISLGALSSTVASPPSPLMGIGFAASALVFVVSLMLAGRITIALERARRVARPPIENYNTFPIVRKLFRPRRRQVHVPDRTQRR